jgi:hypothetical protein
MITVTDIQKDLPDWPTGVIEPWLIEFGTSARAIRRPPLGKAARTASHLVVEERHVDAGEDRLQLRPPHAEGEG